MTLPAKIRVNAQANFPALVQGSGPITITKVNGVWTIGYTGSPGGGSGTVTEIDTGTGLTGGPITTTGTVALANTAVTPGSYTATNLTVDAQGRITAAASGSGGGVSAVGIPVFAKISDAQAATIPVGNNTIQLLGYNTPGDNGGGAYGKVTSLPALAPGFTSADGAIWQLLPTAPVHTAQYGISPATTDNKIPFQNFNRWLATTAVPSSSSLGLSTGAEPQPAATVTISIANPAVITVTAPSGATGWTHGLRNGSMVSFSTTGTLPTGIVAGQIYYVQYGSVTPTTFQISTTSIFLDPIGSQTSPKGTPIATSGTQSGTHSYTTYGESWTDIVLDPGNYYASNGQGPVLGNGLRKWRLLGYGARFQTLVHFDGAPWLDTNAALPGTVSYQARFQTTIAQNQTGVVANSITLVTPAQASNFYVNSWVVLMALELQSSQIANWNQAVFEYAKIRSVDASSGVITFYDPLQYGYRSTYPTFAPPAGGWSGASIGPATIVQMSDTFDQEIELRGLGFYGITEEVFAGLLSLRLVDCEILGWGGKTGPFPSTVRKFVMERCNIHNSISEIDKMVDTAHYIDCVFDNNSPLLLQSASINQLVIERCKLLGGMGGTSKSTTIRDSYISGPLDIGTVYGATERMLLVNSHINRTRNANEQFELVTLPSVSFSNGTLKVLVGNSTVGGTLTWLGPATPSFCPIIWAVPGAKIAICSTGLFTFGTAMGAGVQVGGAYSMMTIFTVLDVYCDGSGNFCVDTTLTALPTANITVTGTMSGSALTVTAISPVDACLLANMNIVATAGGTLPANTIIQSDIGVPNATSNLGVYTLSHAPASGAPTSFTASTPMNFLPHPCPRLTVLNCTGGQFVTDMAGAPPDIPMFSYLRRAYAGFPIYPPYYDEAFVHLAGNLTTWTIDVKKPYTGSAGTYNCVVTIFGWVNASGNYYPTFLTQTINLKTAGVRTITATTTTGGVAGDTIAAVPFWLSGGHLVSISAIGGGDTLVNMPYFIMTGLADQGIDFASMVVNTTNFGMDHLSDTVTGMSLS